MSTLADTSEVRLALRRCFGDDTAEADLWLAQPNMLLGGAAPIELCMPQVNRGADVLALLEIMTAPPRLTD